VKFGVEEGTFGPLLHAKFHPHRCNVSPLWGKKPQNRPLSKLNTGRFALRTMLPVKIATRVRVSDLSPHFCHLLWSIASSVFNLHAWQSFCTTSLQVLFGLPLGLQPSTSYSIHFFNQSVSSFCNTYPYHSSLFCCSTKIISSTCIPNLSLNSLLGTIFFTLTPHIHLTILISARWSVTSFSFQ